MTRLAGQPLRYELLTDGEEPVAGEAIPIKIVDSSGNVQNYANRVSGATENNITTFNNEGNIKDSKDYRRFSWKREYRGKPHLRSDRL